MRSEQYEELCRRVIAEQDTVPLEQIQSLRIPNAKRADLPEYRHQIDLYWETGSPIRKEINIANAKWRGSGLIDQPDVLLLEQVRQSVRAHKAVLITNIGFTAGAIAAAKDHEIALLVVTPVVSTRGLPANDRTAIQAEFDRRKGPGRGPLYSLRVETRGLGGSSAPSQRPSAPPLTSRALEPGRGGYITRDVPGGGGPTRQTGVGGPTETRGGPGFGGSGFGPGSFRQK